MAQPVFVGINGNVIRLDGATGDGQWLAELTGSGFVNVLLDGDRVIATTNGEVFCLDAATGKRIWHNGLSGQGFGLAGIAIPNAATNAAPLAEKQRQLDAAATATSASSANG
jgi:outer membrane protein assembly factor BamB